MANNPKNQDEHEEKVQESSPKKELICKSVYGKVKWFNVKRGYGFVCRNDNQEDVFIHQSAIVKSNPDHPRKSVGENEEIYFDIVKGIKGNEAANVCGADGNHVKGSEYALRYQRIRFRGRGRGRGRGRTRVMSEEVDNHPQEINRGGGGGGRVFRGGRPYMVQYRRPHPGYEMPPPPPSQFYYDMPYDYYRGGPPRGRFQRGGGYRGGYREGRGGGGPPHPSRGGDVAMNFPPYEYEFMDRRPPRGGGGRGRPRFRSGRGRGRGRGGVVKDFGEERPLPHDGGNCEEDDDVCRGE